MSGQRKWSEDEIFQVIFETLKGIKPVVEICRERGISQTQFYKWRDVFLEGAKQALKDRRNPKNRDPLSEENRKLKQLIGEYAVIIETQKKFFQGENV